MTGLALVLRFGPGQAGVRAILRAARAGEFGRLPADKYEHWRTMRLTFGIDSMGLTE